jgi:signal transduction histidine kinase
VPLFHDKATWKGIKGHITDPSANARQETNGEMKRSDGSILTYVTKPLPDGNTLIAFADVSAQRSVEGALRERAEAFETADRLKTEFVKNVSYQLRSPLQTILGYGEFLQMERIGDLNEAQKDKVDAICEASNHLNDLIGNILDLAMIEAGRMDLDISEVDLGALVKEAVSIGVTNAADTEVEVVADVVKGLGMIEADEKRIRQVLFNLVSNALRFTDAGGKVTITAERMGDTAKLTVKDNGRGIPAEEQATRFDSFTSSDQRGAGLGLSLVKHFVQLHGGNVGIKSTPGAGTEVVCWIPVEAQPMNGSGEPHRMAA